MLSWAVRLPAAVGANRTPMVQAPSGAIVAVVQVPVAMKSAGFVPVIEMLLTVIVATPVLVSVTVRAVLVEPTAWRLKVRLPGVRLTTAPSARGVIPPCL